MVALQSMNEEQRLSTAQRNLECARGMLPSSVIIPPGWGSGLTVLDSYLSISARVLKPDSKKELLHHALNDLELLEELNSFSPEYRQHLSEAAAQIQDTIYDSITWRLHLAESNLTLLETHLAEEKENIQQLSKKHDISVEDTEADSLKMDAHSVIPEINFLRRDQQHGRMTQEQENLYFDLINRFKIMLPMLKHLDLVSPPIVKERLASSE